MKMVGDLLSPHYRLHQLMVDPSDVGHAGVRRPRTYIICSHRDRCTVLRDPFEMYSVITQAICATVQTEPQDYMVASPVTQALQLQQVCTSRRLQYDPAPRPIKYPKNLNACAL